MTGLSRLTRDAMNEQLKGLHDAVTGLGVDARFVEVGANAPEVLDWYFNSFYTTLFYGGRVDAKTKELLRLRLSKTHGCLL